MTYISRLESGRIVKIPCEMTADKTCDVLVVGAGCAGIYAADAAASEGARVILIENSDSIGGMHIRGRVMGYYYGFSGGSFESDEYTENDEKYYKMSHKVDKKQLSQLARLKKSGVSLYTSYTPVGVIMDEDRVIGICAFDGEREIQISSKIVIDATSDGHLIRMLNIEKRYGREIDGRSAPFTVYSTYEKDGKIVYVNEDAGHINQYDTRDFSKKALTAHRDLIKICERGDFIHVAPRTGVREGLSFEGCDTLRYEDIILGRECEKPLMRAYSDLDRHGHDKALDDELYQSFWVISNLATVTISIPVPMGAVVPRGICGIVTAGRCLSADSYAAGAVRMVRDMFRMGECVGTAAALAVKDGVDFLDIDYGRYLERVRERGCFCGEGRARFGFDFPKRGMPYTPIDFGDKDNLEFLKTETPGVGIWYSYLNRESKELGDRLFSELLSAEDELQRYNLAIALGVMGDRRALPTLREIIDRRDTFYFKDCRRSNQFRSVIAICLVGRLGDGSDVRRLWDIAFSDGEYSRDTYHTLEPNYLYYKGTDRNFLYFDVLTHTVAALLKIHKKCGLPTDALAREIATLIESGKAVERIALDKRVHGTAHTETLNFLKYMLRSCN